MDLLHQLEDLQLIHLLELELFHKQLLFILKKHDQILFYFLKEIKIYYFLPDDENTIDFTLYFSIISNKTTVP